MSEVEKIAQSVSGIQDPDNITEETNLRYAAYANRLRTILRASHRYVAYTSDIGESFRPVAHPLAVRLGYGISWLYILGDVSYVSWVTKLKSEGRYTPGLRPWSSDIPQPDALAAQAFNTTHDKLVESDWRLVGLKRGIFQSVASMGLPAFTIHSSVRYSSYLFKNAPKTLKTYGPVGIGLGIVPLLPYIFDEPVEEAVDWIFNKGEDIYKSTFK